ncbi:MAG: hypothetical protein RL329_3884 [Bacteroidota bacterium]
MLRKQAPSVELPDADVIRRYLSTQDPAYFSILYRKYAGKVYGKCLSILKEEELARDAMQEIFMKILLNLSAFGEKSMFSTWIYSITYNYCIDMIRRKKKEQTLFTDDIERAPDVAEEEIPDEYLMEMDVKQLKVVLATLPEGDRIILLMKYQDERSIKEIAEALKKTESAIKMKIKRAKQKAVEIFKQKFPAT